MKQGTTDPRIQGILCNDPTGLCLASRGDIGSTTVTTTTTASGPATAVVVDTSGVYTSLLRLANQIEGTTIDDVDNDDAVNTPKDLRSATPYITIETVPYTIVVKEYYDGHTVAIKLPSKPTIATTTAAAIPTSETSVASTPPNGK